MTLKEISSDHLCVPTRPRDSHKGTFGKILVIGGSVGMSGAISLSAAAALRGGAGLVTAAVPRSVQMVVASFNPCYMTVGLPENRDGQISNHAIDVIQRHCQDKSAIAIGPGLGRSAESADVVRFILQTQDVPIVIDADALNLAAEHRLLQESANSKKRALILTPHPGEFSRLSGLTTAQIQADRKQAAVSFARQQNAIVVLKGQGTIVTDGKEIFVNRTGNPGMATGGSGDVLTGLTAALIAQCVAPVRAAMLAVHLHGLAGDLAAAALSEEGMVASDLLEYLAMAWKQVRRN